MFEGKDGRVGGSIDRARVAELYAATDDEELRAYYRDLLGESDEGKALDKLAESEPEAEPEAPVDDLDELRAQAEDRGIKVDGRWGADRLREEIADYEIKQGGES